MSVQWSCDIVLVSGLVLELVLIVFKGVFKNGDLVYIEAL